MWTDDGTHRLDVNPAPGGDLSQTPQEQGSKTILLKKETYHNDSNKLAFSVAM
jgi:hypothetical protein